MWKTIQRVKFNTTITKKKLLSDKSPLTPEGKGYLVKEVDKIEKNKLRSDGKDKENKISKS